MGLQALLHVATAACARQGLSGRDQVRKHCFSASFQATHHDFSKDVALIASEICDRVELRLQQRPNSLSDDMQALLHIATAACARQGPSGPDQVRMPQFLVQLSTHYTWLISQQLSQVIWSAGSDTAANCSLCEAGTFGTGSGQGALIGLSNFHAI